MKNEVAIGLVALAASVCVDAQAGTEKAAAMTEPREYVGANGKVFRYRWHEPAKIEDGKKYPLVFLMHGAGERGTNNVSQLLWGAAEVLDYAVTSGNDCYFVAGQVPGNQRWVEVDWGEKTPHKMPAEPSETMALQIEFAEKILEELPVDRDRVYATGISMGGYGTWDFISRKPEWFAAAMPVCGGADTRQAWKLTNIAIWMHHGDKDTTVPFVRSRLMADALWRAGSDAKYTEYPGVAHGSWGPAYNNKANIAWLFAQKRKPTPRIPFASGDKIAFLGDSITELGTKNETGYVNLVMAGLAAKGVKAELVPAGVSGNMSNQMLDRLERDVLSKQPKWMFLSCGVNDAPNGYEDERKNPGIPLADYVKNITEIVTRSKAAGISVIMLEPTPVVEEPHLANQNEKAYVAEFRKIAAKYELPIVPLNAVFNAYRQAKGNPFERELTKDGTHMSPLGDRLMADVILHTLGW